MDSHIPRPLTLSDLWLPGDVLGGAMLTGWSGPIWDHAYGIGARLRDEIEGDVIRGWYWFPGVGARGLPNCDIRLDFTRPEVRDRAVRVLGADLLPIHAAEVNGDITPGEAAGLVWVSVLRRGAGLAVVGVPENALSFTNTCAATGGLHGESYAWMRDATEGLFLSRAELRDHGLSQDALSSIPSVRYGWKWGQQYGDETGDAALACIHSAALAAGYSLREPDGILLLPLPDGIGRLDTRQ